VHDRQQIRDADVGAGELVEGKVVVAERVPVDDDLQLPLHDVGRHALGVGHAGPIEARQLL
jgi:hypothetical protein